MDPQYLLLLVAAIACPVLMGGAMWLMMRQMNAQQMPMDAKGQPTAQRIAALQAQRESLDKEIRELEQVQALQAQRDQLQRQVASAPGKAQAQMQMNSAQN